MLSLIAATVFSDLIFNGKDLDGWTQLGGGEWKVEKGVLTGTCAKSDPQGILLYKEPVKDFSAKLQFKISGGNSGFYFRTERVEGQPLVKGFQAEIDAIDDVAGIWETAGRGWVFKPTPEIHATAKFVPGEWSRMEVTAQGPHYVVKLNGKTITDIQDTQGRKEGWIGLQLHGGIDMTVSFKDIRLVHLKSER